MNSRSIVLMVINLSVAQSSFQRTVCDGLKVTSQYSYFLQIGVANDGKLNGIDMSLYCDCGSSPNDLDVSGAQAWADNGKCYASF